MSVAKLSVLAGAFLGILGIAGSAFGELVYVDAIDGAHHPGSASPNTFNAASHNATDWLGLGDGDGWRFRDTGPADESYGTSAYQGKLAEGDVELYTKVTGLSPGQSYGGLRLYFVAHASNTGTWLVQYSLDGATWSAGLGYTSSGVVRLATSTTDPLGSPSPGGDDGDTRCYFPIPGTLTADGSGEIKIFVRPAGSDRSVYDGFAYDDGIVPGPTTAFAPQPPNEANLFGTGSVTSLSWSNPRTSGTVTCDVYFGDENDYAPGTPPHYGLPLLQGSVAGTSVTAPALSEGDQYFWIVDCVDTIDGTLSGELWSFEVLAPSAATGVIISEFMAANDATLTNSLGGVDDWIELYNNSGSPVDLGGWYLTDSDGELAKWQIPSVPSTLLAADSYLIIWASNENTVTNGEIHTSFRLSAGGEYLALVRPDGITVEHEYSPSYPEQDDDISYGVDLLINGADVTLAPSQSACQALVPTGDIGTNWHARVYDDGSWQAGGTGVGYETTGTDYEEEINTDVQVGMYNQMPSVYVRIPFQVEDPELFSALNLHMLFEDGFVAYINGLEVARSNAPVLPAWNAAATSSRSQTEALETRTFNVSQDLSALLVTGTNVLAIHAMNQTSGAATFLVQPTLEATLENGVTLEQKRYYSVPTPGSENSDAFLGFVADTKFSVDRGFYSSPFSVEITCKTAGAAIRYTLDGTTPTDVHGTLYTGTILVNTTTALRAVAYKTGWRSSDTDAQTYIFIEDVLTQPTAPAGWPSTWEGNVTFDAGINWSDYQMDPQIINSPNNLANDVRAALTNIPTISLVTDLDNLFDPDTGSYANPREQGVLWERPASAEMIYPDGTEGFQINCGLRIQGNGSRGPNSTPKHSLRLLFKGVYGPTKLKHAMFEGSPVESFDTIHLRAVYNNAWTKTASDQRARAQDNQDQFARDLQLAMGQKSIYGSLCHLYINGLYWGVYHPGERPDASWAASHFGGKKEEWDSLNSGTPVDGDANAWDDLWTRSTQNMSVLQNYTDFAALCDVTSLCDYLVTMHYVDIHDWDNKNTYAVRRRLPGETFRFICWDSERALESSTGDEALSVDRTKRPSGLFQNVKGNSEFQLLFADRVHKHFFNDGVMTHTRATNIWRQRSDVIDTVIAAESARWGDFRQERGETTTVYTPAGHYFPYQTSLLNGFFPGRTAFMLGKYASMGLYPSLDAPEFSQHGGTFTNSLNVTISGPGTIYYTLDGSDPREYGTGSIQGTQYTGAIPLTYSTRVKARAKSGSTWSALLEADFLEISPSPLRVSEVMYAPRIPSGPAEEAVSENSQHYAFVEIHNTDPGNTVGLVGVSISDGLQFDFSKGDTLSLPPGGYMVVVENPAAFAVRYPSVTADKIAGEYRGDLTFSGDSIKFLVEGVGQVVSFDYSDGRGWPLAADGAGHSLIPLVMDNQSSGQLNYGGNWKASVNADGSPGAPEPNPIAVLALNEVIAHTDFSDPGYPDYDSNDKIELINHDSSTISLNGYYLSDDAAFLKKWAVPAGINVPAGGMIVFDEITGFHSPLTNGFGLDKAGEQVLLSYALGGGPASVVDAVTFNGQANGRSLGRYPDATGDWRECLPTPSANNVLAGQQPVISEIMYHPTSNIPFIDNTAAEFVEIHNPTGQDVNLWTTETGSNIGSWRLDGEVDYVFPESTVLSASSHALVVSFDPANATNRAAFLARYGLSEPITLFGPFSGKLSNEGGRLALERPQGADLAGGAISWVIVDEVIYAEDTPWMPSADGLGDSLHRTAVSGSGLNPTSWTASTPNPESGSAIPSDLDLFISHTAGELKLHFNPQPGYSYAVEMNTNGLGSTQWVDYITVTNPATEFIIDLPDDVSPAFFRLRRDP